jgi:hypothetical protein
MNNVKGTSVKNYCAIFDKEDVLDLILRKKLINNLEGYLFKRLNIKVPPKFLYNKGFWKNIDLNSSECDENRVITNESISLKGTYLAFLGVITGSDANFFYKYYLANKYSCVEYSTDEYLKMDYDLLLKIINFEGRVENGVVVER